MKNIERFLDNVIKENDIILLDILWTLFCSSGYDRHKEKFKKWFGRICKRNLQKKYNLKPKEIKEKMLIFIDFFHHFYEGSDELLMKNILVNKTSEILIQNIRSKIPYLSDLNKKILSFVLHYIPIRAYRGINYFKICTKDCMDLFNLLFDEELKEERFKVKSDRWDTESMLEPYEEYSFDQFGDELMKVGAGYWAFYISDKKVWINFIIPSFIYEAIKDYKSKLPIIENFKDKLVKIEKIRELEEEWGIEDFEETKTVSEVLESEIEASIRSNPEILEEGLKLVRPQYPTPVGPIDILCKDKNGNFVVIELKRGKESDKVVGQIQRYMAWVSENLAKNKQVRGIIALKEYDQKLEYAVKGSKFPIEIKIFGKEPPVEKNIKYCPRCGKPNPKSAKYCIKCGKEFWM